MPLTENYDYSLALKSATLHKGVRFAEPRGTDTVLHFGTHIADLQSWEKSVNVSAKNGKQASHLYGQMQLDGLCPNPFFRIFLFRQPCTKCIKRKEVAYE